MRILFIILFMLITAYAECPEGCYYHPAFNACFSSYSTSVSCYKIEGCFKSALYGACEAIFTPESQGHCRSGYIDDQQLSQSVKKRLNDCLLDEKHKRYIQDSIKKFKMDSTIMYLDSIRYFRDSVNLFIWKRDSSKLYNDCYKSILPLSKEIKEKEKDFKNYFNNTFDRNTRCDYIEKVYRRAIQSRLDSIQSYKDSVTQYKQFVKDSIAEYKAEMAAYKKRHSSDFNKTTQKRIGGILIKKHHVRSGSNEWVRFYIFNDVEGDGDAFEVMHDNKCDNEDEWTDDCYLNDDYIDQEVPIFYKGEHIATVNIDYYSQKKLSWSSICHIDDSRNNDIKACVRKFK